jgi:hypothetical protein
MKVLIYKLFSGVGFCNQLFSLETSIYLSNISKRKLILLIPHPLCHCGKASWDYGYILNFFTKDFLNYLPYGFEVYYHAIPDHITKILDNTSKCKELKYEHRFSNTVFVDSELDTEENKEDIKNFIHSRRKDNLQFEENNNYEYLYITQSNASRCFYNFYTTPQNYMLMKHICESLKINTFIQDCADHIYTKLVSSDEKKKNNFNIFCHLRFGDLHKNKDFITRFNNAISKQVGEYIDGHLTNTVKPVTYFMIDNKTNTEFLEKMKKYNYKYSDELVTNHIDEFMKQNEMVCYDFQKCKKNEVANALIEMLLCVKSNEFIGTSTSTLSHYIQYLRYMKNKSHSNYSNLTNTNVRYCRFQEVTQSRIPWIRYKYSGGHVLSWHLFWSLDTFFGTNPPGQSLYTIVNKTDGFGSQLQAGFSLIAYCMYSNNKYIHSPFTRMQHNDESLDNYPQIMNDFMNIEHSFQSINDISNYDKSRVNGVKEGYFVHGSYHPEFFYNELVLSKLREIYYSNPKPELSKWDSSKKNIVLHIRRGDVTKEKYPTRYTLNSEYIRLLNVLIEKKMIEELDEVDIHVMSEGKEDDFEEIKKEFPNVFFHLSTNTQESFHMMTQADVLVLSKSSFCYCAALINSNLVIANNIEKWWHKPLKSWTIV